MQGIAMAQSVAKISIVLLGGWSTQGSPLQCFGTPPRAHTYTVSVAAAPFVNNTSEIFSLLLFAELSRHSTRSVASIMCMRQQKLLIRRMVSIRFMG